VVDKTNSPRLKQIRSFAWVFWITNTMEMWERLSCYGLRTVTSTYMVLSIAQGGPEFDPIQKGVIYG
jgi:dipeptide/tripeptide permease